MDLKYDNHLLSQDIAPSDLDKPAKRISICSLVMRFQIRLAVDQWQKIEGLQFLDFLGIVHRETYIQNKLCILFTL